jgi:predicted transcriptional regulator
MGLDQRSLAKTLGVSQSTVSRAEAHNKREEWYARMVWLLWYGLEQQQLIANLRLALGEQMAARRSPAPHD